MLSLTELGVLTDSVLLRQRAYSGLEVIPRQPDQGLHYHSLFGAIFFRLPKAVSDTRRLDGPLFQGWLPLSQPPNCLVRSVTNATLGTMPQGGIEPHILRHVTMDI